MLDLLPDKEELCRLFIYQPSDGTLLWREGHNGVAAGSRAGRTAPNANGYYEVSITIAGVRRRFYAHRIIYAMHHGKSQLHVDHINTIKTDNRIDNLRAVTRSQNMHNARLAVTNTSGVKGVCWDKSRNKWTANVWLGNRQVHIGRFDNKEEATDAVREAREKLHGEFANHG